MHTRKNLNAKLHTQPTTRQPAHLPTHPPDAHDVALDGEVAAQLEVEPHLAAAGVAHSLQQGKAGQGTQGGQRREGLVGSALNLRADRQGCQP